LNFGSRPTSDIVDSVISELGMAEKNGSRSWNRGAMSRRSKVIFTSGLVFAILNSGNQPASGNVGSGRQCPSWSQFRDIRLNRVASSLGLLVISTSGSMAWTPF